MLVAAVASLDGIERAAVAAVAGRAAKFSSGWILIRSGSGWLVNGASLLLAMPRSALVSVSCDGNEQRVRADVAGLAAIDQAGAAEIVDRVPGGFTLIWLQRLRPSPGRCCSRPSSVGGAQAGQCSLTIVVELGAARPWPADRHRRAAATSLARSAIRLVNVSLS